MAGKILVVDDEISIRELIKFNLQKAGFSVVEADNGLKAIQLAKEKPDLIVLDLMLPGLDGLEVCRLLKNDRQSSSIPILMLTARDDEFDKVVGLELSRAKHSNPLTGLPGNVLIEEKLKQIIAAGGDFAVLYFDIDNFKPYNDIYGFENGDKVLCATATLIQKWLAERNSFGAFFGHIGGDDFVAIVQDKNVAELCQAVIGSFDERVKDFYSEEDRQQGNIVALNRHGIIEKYPLISLSIAVVTSGSRIFRSPEEIGEAAGMVKKRCKMIWQSCYEIS